MSEWIPELQSALSREFADRPVTATLATVDKSNGPRARTVICRRVADDGALLIVSDARTEKADQIRANPQAEVVFWLPTLREQFRVLGTAKLTGPMPPDNPLRLELWRGLSDAARAMFQWPAPGARRNEGPAAFAETVPPETDVPANFEVITLRPKRVEHLQLAPRPHRRRRWMLAGKWSAAAELNP